MTTKELIALDFIALHNNSDVSEWLLQSKDLTDIYNKLEQGVFGNVECDEDGSCSLEISHTEAASGHAEIFEFDIQTGE